MVVGGVPPHLGEGGGVPIPTPRSWPWLPPPGRAGRASIPTTRPSRIRPTCRRRSAIVPRPGQGPRRRTMRRSCAASSRPGRPLRRGAGQLARRGALRHRAAARDRRRRAERFAEPAYGRRLRIPVVAGPSEATAIGNVMVQARALGLVGSLARMRDYIRRSVEVREFLPRTK